MSWLISFLVGLVTICTVYGSNDTKNVLLIIVDDLRPEIGAWLEDAEDSPFNKDIYTPNIDRLANQSIRFPNAFAQYPTCGPSRASFLTGRRPETINVLRNAQDFRDTTPDIVTLPQYFKNNNYKSYGFGKIYHDGQTDNDYSWSEDMFQVNISDIAKYDKIIFQGESWGSVNGNLLDSDPLVDMLILDAAKDKLDEIKNNGDKFFMAVGFRKPHLPMICPTGYFDLYDPANVSMPDDSLKYVPDGMPDIEWAEWLDLYTYTDIDGIYDNSYNHTLDEAKTIELRRAYYSCVTYIDSLVGDLLEKLDDLDFAKNTVVAFISDHGFHLGEHSHWTKGSLLNLDLNVPWMLKIPGETDQTTEGLVSNRLVENIDIFPTLVEAAGLGYIDYCFNASDDNLCHEGMSAYRFVNDQQAEGKRYVLSQYIRTLNDTTYIGYSVSNPRYHYIRWVEYQKIRKTGDIDALYSEELYVLKEEDADPNETVNQADNATYEEAKSAMLSRLKRGWEKGLPEDERP